MSIPAFIRKLYPNLLPLRDAIEIVNESEEVADSSKPALKSAALDSVRYAMRSENDLPSKQDALDTDIRPLLAVMPAAARVAAEAKNHRSPGDHEGRARRFVEALTGGRSVDRSKLRFPCPPAWQPLVDAIPDRKNANGEMSFLHRCCMVAGIQDSPATMPSYDQIVDAARHINGEVGVRRATKASMPQYRTARHRLVEDVTDDEERAERERMFAPLPTAASGRTCHLGVEPEAAEMLKIEGYNAEAMTPDEMFRALAPGLAADYDYWASGPGAQRSASFREQCYATLMRVAGWVIRAGHGGRLQNMQLPDFFLIDVPVDGELALNPRLAQRLGSDGGSATVSLLEHAADSEAGASLRRSTVTDAEIAGTDKNGRPWYTEAMHANCSRIWSMTAAVYRKMGTRGGEPSREWGLVQSRWGSLQKQLAEERKLPTRHRIHAKNKLKMVQTITLPQLVCVGMPLRRREIRAMRKGWLAAVQQAEEAGHTDPHAHPEVAEVEEQYFDAVLRFTVLSLAIDDGLRLKQYTRGRLGTSSTSNFRPELDFDAAGNACGVAALATHWIGDKRDPAHLKITDKNKAMARRDRRRVRRGLVDHIGLWDLIRHWRPQQLVANGSFADLASYGLPTDLREGRYALFPSPQDVCRDEKSRTDVSEIFGKELHYIVKKWLRPDLPELEAMGPDWRALWAIHISRLLIGSYWGGARDDWKTASYLTMDTEATLRGEYSLVDEGLRDRLGLDETNWEHLNAYDRWMDRLFWQQEEFDPLEDPDLPLPPHLKGAIPEEEDELPTKRRIRRARPGQKAPKQS